MKTQTPGGYIFIGVCLFVSRITKLIFTIVGGRWHTRYRRNH